MLGPMGSNLQRVLGLMTPESVNAIVEHTRDSKKEDILAVDTSVDASKKDEQKYEQYDQDDNDLSKQKEEPEQKKLKLLKPNASVKKEKTGDPKVSKHHNHLECEVLHFDYSKIKEMNKIAKQKSAITSYQSNIVPNYLKGTKRNDLQGLLVNKKCG